MNRVVRLALALVAAGLVQGPAEAQITWEADYEAALAKAREQGRVVLIAVNMDGEGANDALAEQVYRDKRVVQLTAGTVNLVASRFSHAAGAACKRFAGISCEDHKRVEVAIRGGVVKEDEGGFVIAPQHVLLAPDGSVILSVPYAITAEELLWCLVSARQTLPAEVGLPMPEEAQAPRRLVMKGVHDPAQRAAYVRPLSEDELESSIKSMRKGWGALEDLERFYQIIATDNPLAIRFASIEIGGGTSSWSPEMTCLLVRAVARYSPPSFWESLEPCLGQQDERVRAETAAALEQLAERKSLSAIRKALSKESSVQVRCDLLRALGAAGAGNAAVAKSLISTGKSDGQADLRLNAILALAYHVERKDVREALVAALADEDPRVRQAAALAMAFSRWSDFSAQLGASAKSEQDVDVSAVLARASAVLAGGNLRSLADDYERIGGTRIRRVRYFGDE